MMKRSLRVILITMVTIASLLAPISMSLAHASPATDACDGIKAVGGECDTSAGTSGFTKIITAVINVLTILVGALCVVMIIIGGFRYVISAGDSNGVSGAKNTILYALIGLVVVIFARTIVAFVFTKTNGATQGSNSGSGPSNNNGSGTGTGSGSSTGSGSGNGTGSGSSNGSSTGSGTGTSDTGTDTGD